ncbi:unnamed protein product [Caenorhabditis sp. 36 PRJEB53466]|nr:unnamed protein product [Caenorhabditis sp. 36 PRJEB53466]
MANFFTQPILYEIMSHQPLLLLLLGLSVCHAVIRPGYGSGHKHYSGDDCSDEHHHQPHPSKKASTSTVAPTEPITSTAVPSTSTIPPTTTSLIASPVCPSGWTLYTRTPSSYNLNTGLWCMKLITSATSVTINSTSALCQAEGGVLTDFETSEEKDAIVAEAQAYIVTTLGLSSGSIALAGDRVPECVSMNASVIAASPCNDQSTIFSLPASASTNPAYLWTTWAIGEPNSNHWTYDVEDCLQLHVQPSVAAQHGLINDFYCYRTVAPNDPSNTLYMNYGALCGQAPSYEAVGK